MASSKNHRAELADLAKKDPDFYAFLQKEDADLLKFDDSDEEEVEEGEDEREEEVPVEEEDQALSDVDGEDEDVEAPVRRRSDAQGRCIIDLAFLVELDSKFQTSNSGRIPPSAVKEAIQAFVACVARVGADVEPPECVVNEEKVFDGIVRLCFHRLGTALFELLGPIKEEDEDQKSKDDDDRKPINFHRLKKHYSMVKQYLHSLLLFLKEIQTDVVIKATLRAIAQLIDVYAHFSKLMRLLIPALILTWSRKTAICRNAAFTAIRKIVQVSSKHFPFVLKSTYLSFVSSARNVSTETRPLLHLMRRQFAALCMIRPAVAYHYAFVYIRQIAIHLRNAMIAKRKDLIGTVYNWQVMQCLYLWSTVLSAAHKSEPGIADAIAELVYPMVQIVTGLYPSVRFFPLRLHCMQILLDLQNNCNVYIPTLALASEMLNDATALLKRKPSSKDSKSAASIVRPPQLNCLLRMAPSQADQPMFRQAIMDNLFRLMLEACWVVRAEVAFDELTVIPHARLRTFLKGCRSFDNAKLFRSLSTKITEHAKFSRQIVDGSAVDLTDAICAKNLQLRLAVEDLPLAKFIETWRRVWKMRDQAEKPEQPVSRPKILEKKTTTIEKRKADARPLKPKDEIKTEVQPRKKRRLNVSEQVHPKKAAGSNSEIADTIADLVMSDSDDE